jgi:hypothetical protein
VAIHNIKSMAAIKCLSKTYQISTEKRLFRQSHSTDKNNWRVVMSKENTSKYLLFLLCICLVFPLSLYAAEKNIGLSEGQILYVPAYSHIYSGNKETPFLLTVTLSIRNVDPKHQIKIVLVDYYETQGNLLKNLINKPIALKSLESLRYVIPERDKSGGSGANFMIEWRSEKFVNPPIVESIMIGTQSTQGISFTSRGQEIIASE